MRGTFWFLLLLSLNCFSQKSIQTSPLKTIDPLSSFNDLEKLDSLFFKKQLIGVGESTHGSSEFTIMRHRLFKYLVERHGFNTFFLEADYGACQRINRYIQGGKDTISIALKEVKFWTWRTKELLEIIEWARSYNQSNENQIRFVGCDMQYIDDDYLELKRALKSCIFIELNIDSVFNQLNNNSKDSLIQLRYNKWRNLKQRIISLSQNNSIKLHPAHIRGIDQWFEYKTNPNYNFRDSCMAKNISSYLHENEFSKGFYFAHNWHVSNSHHEYTKDTSIKTTGAYLKEEFEKCYLCIAMLSQNLEFNALSCVDGHDQFGIFNHQASNKNSLEKNISYQGDSLCYINAQSIPTLSKYIIINIGAVYRQLCEGFKAPSEIQLQDNMFDGFIFIENTKPTNIIPR